MRRINVYDNSQPPRCLYWFDMDTVTVTLCGAGKAPDVSYGSDTVCCTSRGRWVIRSDHEGDDGLWRHLTGEQAREWLETTDDPCAASALAQYCAAVPDPPAHGGRPTIGRPVTATLPDEVIARIDAEIEVRNTGRVPGKDLKATRSSLLREAAVNYWTASAG
jgi:hypothetical protein